MIPPPIFSEGSTEVLLAGKIRLFCGCKVLGRKDAQNLPQKNLISTSPPQINRIVLLLSSPKCVLIIDFQTIHRSLIRMTHLLFIDSSSEIDREITSKTKGKNITKENVQGVGRREYYHWPFDRSASCLKPLLAHAGFIGSLRLNSDDKCVQPLLLPIDVLARGHL